MDFFCGVEDYFQSFSPAFFVSIVIDYGGPTLIIPICSLLSINGVVPRISHPKSLIENFSYNSTWKSIKSWLYQDYLANLVNTLNKKIRSYSDFFDKNWNTAANLSNIKILRNRFFDKKNLKLNKNGNINENLGNQLKKRRKLQKNDGRENYLIRFIKKLIKCRTNSLLVKMKWEDSLEFRWMRQNYSNTTFALQK